MRRCFAFCFVFASCAGIFLACQDDTKPPVGADSTHAPTSGVPRAGGSTDGAVAEAGDDADGGACNAVVDTGSQVERNGIVGDPPPQTGGTIADGLYDLTEVSTYVGLSGVGGPTGELWEETINVTGNILDRVRSITSDAGAIETRESFTFVVSGTSFNVSETCPIVGSAAADEYTATATQLTLVDPLAKEQRVYTKR